MAAYIFLAACLHAATALVRPERRLEIARGVAAAESQMTDAMRNVRCDMGPPTSGWQIKNVSGVQTLQEATRSAQIFCVGKRWNKGKCKRAVRSIRQLSWPHIRWLLNHSDANMSLALSAPGEPITKTFRAGGGYGGAFQCKSGGHTAKLYYRHVWKAAGAAIIYNMQALSNSDFVGGSEWDSMHRCQELQREREDGGKPVLFTFVRDPISKFIAGYKEMSYRNLVNSLGGHEPGEARHASTFLDTVLHGGCDNGHVLLQSSNLMSQECESTFDVIGKLESFDDDWQRVSLKAGCEEPLPWDSHAYHHESEEDTLHLTETMTKVLEKNDGMLMNVLCWWMLPDFAIFNYELPKLCRKNQVLRDAYTIQHSNPVFAGAL